MTLLGWLQIIIYSPLLPSRGPAQLDDERFQRRAQLDSLVLPAEAVLYAVGGAADSTVSVWVVPTDENLMIARHTRRLLDS
jgi:hypothetical protein